MKTLWTLIVITLFLWCSPVVAEYCKKGSEGKSTSCIFKTKRNPKDAQVVVSYTRQGWSMMVAVFFKKDFSMIDGDSRVTTKSGDTFDMQYISTRRDLTFDRRMMEAPIYIVNEELLHALSNSKGKVRFWLSAEKPKEVEVEFSSKLFEGLDAYVAETRSVLGDLFKDE